MKTEQWTQEVKYECEKDEDKGGMLWLNTPCDNSSKWASPRTSKEVEMSGSMDYRVM